MQLYPHQRAAVEWLSRTDRAILADDMGLGKTASALVALVPPALVVVPAVVVWNWLREIEAWRPRLRVQHLRSGKDVPDRSADIIVMSHGLLVRQPKLWAALHALPLFETLVVDECHLMRNARAQRSRAVFGHGLVSPAPLAARARRVWGLSGTPMPNTPVDLWMQMRGLRPDLVPENWRDWRRRYCKLAPDRYDPSGFKPVGVINAPELRARLAPMILRRRKGEVLDLPAMRTEVVALRPVKWPPEFEAIMAKVEAKVAQGRKPADVLTALELAGSPAAAFAALLDAAEFSTFARVCGTAKVEPVIDLLTMELEGTAHKQVVVARHLDVVAGIAAGLDAFGCVTITGDVAAKERAARVERFQADATCRVIVVQITAGGVGITLTASSEILFAEMSFVPAENAQARDRIHRIGQTSACRVRLVTLAGTVDEIVGLVLQRKLAMISAVVS